MNSINWHGKTTQGDVTSDIDRLAGAFHAAEGPGLDADTQGLPHSQGGSAT